ncbi:hypothetical protein AG1IA_08363 [Rhizoctonia solani AG-1 IA]|uniref:SWIM-type domain-containing protein n=1 Tax=Thanatephorus cucumeris (strain AG1-IA) TaxID=983506 RepID=L8WLB3_THACA|nr:hypothetical protein AG1IA_08363 [Rhizoctonia solani AG-1 IA]
MTIFGRSWYDTFGAVLLGRSVCNLKKSLAGTNIAPGARNQPTQGAMDLEQAQCASRSGGFPVLYPSRMYYRLRYKTHHGSLNNIPTTDTHSGFFTHLYKDPDSNSGAQLYQRRYQWRPISWNPFDLGDQNEKPRDEEEHVCWHNLLESTTSLGPQDDPAISGIVTFQAEPKPLLNPGPSWSYSVSVATSDRASQKRFLNMISIRNGQFDSTWVRSRLCLLPHQFRQVQTKLSIEFFPGCRILCCSFRYCLVAVGVPASQPPSQGFDVTVYISHSPGMSGELDPKPMEDITDPSRYNSEMTARVSLRIIVFSIAISSRRGRIYHIPRRLRILLSGLTISTALFFIGWGITRTEFGTTTSGARFKYAFWGSGLIVEVLSYIRMPKVLRRWIIALIKKWSTKNDNDKGVDKPLSFTVLPPSNSIIKQPSPSTTALPIPLSNVTLRDRLEAITTIILGEGINGIAGTLYSIISAPGLEGPIHTYTSRDLLVVTQIPEIELGERCTGCYYIFLSFSALSFYFKESKINSCSLWVPLISNGQQSTDDYQSFLSTARRIASDLKNMDEELLEIWTQPEIRSNKKIAGRLVEYGISWSQEYDALVQNMTSRGALWTNSSMSLTNGQREELYIWRWRLSLRSLMRIHGIFMGHDATPAQTQSRIADYYHNVTAPKHDHYTSPDSFADMHYYQILGEVLASSLQSARYIMVFVGCIFILLGALEFARSMPRDRFQCGAVISRLLMGYWVLPTIALAFAIESLIETRAQQNTFSSIYCPNGVAFVKTCSCKSIQAVPRSHLVRVDCNHIVSLYESFSLSNMGSRLSALDTNIGTQRTFFILEVPPPNFYLVHLLVGYRIWSSVSLHIYCIIYTFKPFEFIRFNKAESQLLCRY